jgi:hypothetical protein
MKFGKFSVYRHYNTAGYKSNVYLLIIIINIFRDVANEEMADATAQMGDLIEDLGVALLPDVSPSLRLVIFINNYYAPQTMFAWKAIAFTFFVYYVLQTKWGFTLFLLFLLRVLGVLRNYSRDQYKTSRGLIKKCYIYVISTNILINMTRIEVSNMVFVSAL